MVSDHLFDLLLVAAKGVLFGLPALWMGIVAYGLLVGWINTAGLITDRRTGAVHIHRLQMLLATLAFAAYAIGRIAAGELVVSSMSQFYTDPLLAAFGDSHAFYLFGKYRKSA